MYTVHAIGDRHYARINLRTAISDNKGDHLCFVQVHHHPNEVQQHFFLVHRHWEKWGQAREDFFFPYEIPTVFNRTT